MKRILLCLFIFISISSSVMGIVFNDLAINLSGDIPVVSTIIMLIIMIFGHGINIFMGVLGSFVHPMRLCFWGLW